MIEHMITDIRDARFRAHQSWRGMLARCMNSNILQYKDYGARGITVCKEWLNFESFYRDMGGRSTGLTLERRDNEKGYCLDNCKWTTQKEQMNNTRRQKSFLALGPEGQIEVSKNQTRFANKWNLLRCSISSCLHNHKRYKSHKDWTFDLLIPVKDYLANG
jgi:hypothetical protein